MMKLLLTILLFPAIGYAQSMCVVFDTIRTSAATPMVNYQISVSRVSLSGQMIDLGTITYRTNTSGIVSFSLPRNATCYIQANINGFNVTGGAQVSIPNSASVLLRNLQPASNVVATNAGFARVREVDGSPAYAIAGNNDTLEVSNTTLSNPSTNVIRITTGGGGSVNSFETMNAPSGTDPVADASTDILNFGVRAGITITGNATLDSLVVAPDSTSNIIQTKNETLTLHPLKTLALTAGDGLAGGGDLSTNRSFSVNLDLGDALETVDDSINVKVGGITAVHIATDAVGNQELAADAVDSTNITALSVAGSDLARTAHKMIRDSVGVSSYGNYATRILQNAREVTLKSGTSHTVIEDAVAAFKIINIPAGTYSLGSDTLVFRNKDRFILRGAGVGNTIFQTTGNLAVYFFQCDSFVVEGITFKGGANATFLAQTCNYVTVRNCEVTAGSISSLNNCRYFTLENNLMHDNNLHPTSNHGWEVVNSKYGSIENNKMFNLLGRAVELWGDPGNVTEYVSVTGNNSRNNKSLVLLHNADNNVISSNTSHNDTIAVVVRDTSKFNIIAENTINNLGLAGSNIGIQIYNAADSNSFVANVVQSDVRIDSSGDARKNYFQDERGMRYGDETGFLDGGKLILKPPSTVNVGTNSFRLYRYGGTTTWFNINEHFGATNFSIVHPTAPQLDFYLSTDGSTNRNSFSQTFGVTLFPSYINTPQEIRLEEGDSNGSNYIGISPPASIASNRAVALQDLAGSIALLENNLGSFALTTSAQLATTLSDESGGAGVFPRFSLTTPAQGDLAYYNGMNWVNLAPGTSGQVLHTQGAGANPIWDADDGAGGGAPTDAQYLVKTLSGSLTAESNFVAGAGLVATDGGANAAYTVDINPKLVGRTITITSDSVHVTDNSITATQLDETGNFSFSGIVEFDSDALQLDDTNASHQLVITPGSDLTADRVFTITTGDAARTLTMTGDATISNTNSGDVTLAGTPDYITIANQVITRNKLDLIDDLNTFTSANLATNLTDETGVAGGFVRADSPTLTDPTMSNPIVNSGTLQLSDGAGDSPTLQFNPQTGTGWFIQAIDSDDDLNIFSNTTATENVDIVNIGSGVATLTVEGAIAASNFSGSSSGTNTGDQTITLTGDVTGSGTGSFATTIGADKILESMLKAVNAVVDEDILTYESTTGDFEWQTPAETGLALSATTITVAGTANEVTSSAGAQDLSTNRTWTLSLPTALTLKTKVIQTDTLFYAEGLTANAFETSFSLVDPTADRHVSFPDATGEVSLLGQSIDLSGSEATGVLAAARFPALTGDVTTSAGAVATTIANDAVTYAKMQNVSATNRILGRSTAGAGDVEEITVGGDLSQSGSTFTIANDAVTFAKFQNITDARLLGRSAGSSGDMQEITVGTGLSLSAGELTATGSAPKWSDLQAPTAAMSMVSDATSETVTFDFQSAFSTGYQYTIKQTTGNPTGGDLVGITIADVDVGAALGIDYTGVSTAAAGLRIRATSSGTLTNGIDLSDVGAFENALNVGANNIAAAGYKVIEIPAGYFNPKAGDLTGATALADDADNTNDFTLDQVEFSASAENYASATINMPEDWDATTAPKFKVVYYSGTGHASNTVEWDIATGYIRPDTDSWVAAIGTAATVNDIPTTANVWYVTAVLAPTPAGTAAAGAQIKIRLMRDGDDATNDTHTATSRLIKVLMQYKVNQVLELTSW